MKLGAFITITKPEERGDTYIECAHQAKLLCDVVTVIDGEESWPEEFKWETIGHHFQAGYALTEADWVIHLDTDFILHEKDFDAIRMACEFNSDAPALTFYKLQFVRPDRFNLKSRLVLCVNKKKYGDRIRFNSGGDLCQPSLDGFYIRPEDVPEAKVPFYNYEKPLKTEEQIRYDIDRMERAYQRTFNERLYNAPAFEGWMQMMKGRASKPHEEIPLEAHPKIMQDTLKHLKPEQFGYNGFGSFERNNYAV